MPIIHDPLDEVIQTKEEKLQWERGVAEAEKDREHAYRLAKLKYSTAGSQRLWMRVLVAFAKAPVWLVLAFRPTANLPEHWRKFLDI